MQCEVEERTIRSVRVIVVKCFKYREEGHKCRKCPLREKAQEGEKRLRRVEEEEAVCMAKPQEALLHR